MGTLRTVCGLGAVAGLLGLGPAGAASASCGGPHLGAEAPVVLDLGARTTVTGEGFFLGCDDTGQGAGCGAPPSEQSPLDDVDLFLEQGRTSVVLGTADAADRDGRYAVTWQVTVPRAAPDGFRPGPARLRAASAVREVELR